MTNSELPTAAEALREAVECARNGNTDRGELWLGIAVELRTDAQYRSVNARLFPPPIVTTTPPATTLPAEPAYRGSGHAVPADVERMPSPADVADYGTDYSGAAAYNPGGTIGHPVAEVTQYLPELREPDFATQVIPIVWSVGDKADCAHCHTPIVLCFRNVDGAGSFDPTDDELIWLHKYSDLAVCEVAQMGEGEEAVYTYAEPAHRG